MLVQMLRPGLWRWTAPHPEWVAGDGWDPDVGCVYLEAADAVVLIDPLIPDDPGERERFWRALDGDVERLGLPVRVLLTCPWHARGAADVTGRYGTYPPGPPPAGVSAIALPGGERAYWIPAHGALVVGDALMGRGGGLVPCPPGWVAASGGWGPTRAALRPVLDLPVEMVLPGHGPPMLTDAAAELAAVLADG